MGKVVLVVWLLTGVVAVLLGYGMWRLATMVIRKVASSLNRPERR